MRLLIGAIGKLKKGPEHTLCDHYLARGQKLGRSLGLAPLTMVERPESRAETEALRQAAEAKALTFAVPSGYETICLDPRGEPVSSERIAEILRDRKDRGTMPGLAFLIGGPDGHGPSVRERASLSLSFGAVTLPHGLARIVLAEQIYRAMTILAGHPYHRG